MFYALSVELAKHAWQPRSFFPKDKKFPLSRNSFDFQCKTAFPSKLSGCWPVWDSEATWKNVTDFLCMQYRNWFIAEKAWHFLAGNWNNILQDVSWKEGYYSQFFHPCLWILILGLPLYYHAIFFITEGTWRIIHTEYSIFFCILKEHFINNLKFKAPVA